MSLFSRLKCLLVGHDFDEPRTLGNRAFVSGDPTGFVLLGWDLLPHREIRQTHRCLRCGRLRVRDGLYLPGPEDPPLDESGWPVSEDGRRLPCRPYRP